MLRRLKYFTAQMCLCFVLLHSTTSFCLAAWPKEPIQELVAIDRLLAKLKPGNFQKITDEVAYRLVRFEILYRRLPSSLNRSKTFALRAKQSSWLLNTVPPGGGRYVGWRNGRYLLLELLGYHKRVKADIEKFEDNNSIIIDLYCTKHNRYLSEMYQRLGKYKKSFKCLKAYNLDQPHLYVEFDCLRLAFLLSKLGRLSEAKTVYQRTCDLFPGTESAKIAKMVLDRQSAFRPPDKKRFNRYFSGEYEHIAIKAFLYYKFPNTFKILVHRLSNADKLVRPIYLQAIGDLKDTRAKTVLESYVLNGNRREQLAAVESLVKIGELQYIPHLLECFPCFDEYRSLGLHEFLLNCAPCGPRVSDENCKDTLLVLQTWHEWTKEKLRRGKPMKNGWIVNMPGNQYSKPIVAPEPDWIRPPTLIKN